MNLRIAALALLLVASPSSAHEYWLSPSRYTASPGAPITVQAFAGTGFRGEEKPWDPLHAVRFSARTTKTIDMSGAASPGDLTWIRFAPSDAGGAMLAFESGFTPIELPADKFEKYLADEGLDAALAARHRAGASTLAGRERYRRCAKTWLAGTAADRATTPAGLPMEIVPLSAPGTEGALNVRVLWNRHPLANALVKAWHAPAMTDAAKRDSIAISWRGRTNALGEVTVPVNAAGEWLISSVTMMPCPNRAEADWESTWASLTFER